MESSAPGIPFLGHLFWVAAFGMMPHHSPSRALQQCASDFWSVSTMLGCASRAGIFEYFLYCCIPGARSRTGIQQRLNICDMNKWMNEDGCCCSVTKLHPTLCDPVGCSTPGFPVLHNLSLLKLMSIESVMPPNCLILCHPLLLLHSIFPSIRDVCTSTPQTSTWKVERRQQLAFQE